MYIADVATFFSPFRGLRTVRLYIGRYGNSFQALFGIYGAKRRPTETAHLPALNVASRKTFSLETAKNL